jgi:hypothetical protein
MLFLLTIFACGHAGDDYVPKSVEGYEGVSVLGELTPMSRDNLLSTTARQEGVTYATLTLPREQLFGGATASFVADGSTYCVLVDPEAVTWNQSVDFEAPSETYIFKDNTSDDGDLDLSVGLSANYTGTPGYQMGNFEQAYEDSLGAQVTVNTNECVLVGSLGQVGAHAGRATPEFCEIDTTLHPGREYTIALDTWSLPLDDDLLSFGLAVIEGSCDGIQDQANVSDWECVIPAESCTPEEAEADKCNARESSFAAMELAYCNQFQHLFCDCAINPSADNPSCNTCEGTVGFALVEDQLTVSPACAADGYVADLSVLNLCSAD